MTDLRDRKIFEQIFDLFQQLSQSAQEERLEVLNDDAADDLTAAEDA